MIPDIDNIISVGDDNRVGGGGSGWQRRQQIILSVGREYGYNRYNIGGGYSGDINDQYIEDENYDDNYDKYENDGDGNDEEGYICSDKD